MARRFRYSATPDEIKAYVTSLGYNVEEHHYSADKAKVTGFSITGTDVELSYDIISQHPVTGDLFTLGFGMVGLHSNVHNSEYTPERAEHSRRLYEKLYRRFRKLGSSC